MPLGIEGFTIYNDASKLGLAYVMMQWKSNC